MYCWVVALSWAQSTELIKRLRPKCSIFTNSQTTIHQRYLVFKFLSELGSISYVELLKITVVEKSRGKRIIKWQLSINLFKYDSCHYITDWNLFNFVLRLVSFHCNVFRLKIIRKINYTVNHSKSYPNWYVSRFRKEKSLK